MSEETKNMIRELNGKMRRAKADGHRVWGGYVWEVAPVADQKPARRLCKVEEY